MSDHIGDGDKMVCPHCGLPEEVQDSLGGIWFECGSKHDERRTAFCKEREPLWRELSSLRTANAALVERVKRIEAAADKLAQRHLLVPTTYPQAQAHVAEYQREKGVA